MPPESPNGREDVRQSARQQLLADWATRYSSRTGLDATAAAGLFGLFARTEPGFLAGSAWDHSRLELQGFLQDRAGGDATPSLLAIVSDALTAAADLCERAFDRVEGSLVVEGGQAPPAGCGADDVRSLVDDLNDLSFMLIMHRWLVRRRRDSTDAARAAQDSLGDRTASLLGRAARDGECLWRAEDRLQAIVDTIDPRVLADDLLLSLPQRESMALMPPCRLRDARASAAWFRSALARVQCWRSSAAEVRQDGWSVVECSRDWDSLVLALQQRAVANPSLPESDAVLARVGWTLLREPARAAAAMAARAGLGATLVWRFPSLAAESRRIARCHISSDGRDVEVRFFLNGEPDAGLDRSLLTWMGLEEQIMGGLASISRDRFRESLSPASFVSRLRLAATDLVVDGVRWEFVSGERFGH